MRKTDNLTNFLCHCHVIWEPQIPGSIRGTRASNEIALPYNRTNQMQKTLKFILFWSDTLQYSDCLSVHHQQFKTVYKATDVCQTGNADCLLAQCCICLVFLYKNIKIHIQPSDVVVRASDSEI